MISPRPRRLLRWTLWLSLAVMLLAAAALLVASRLLDLPAVQAKLERQASEAVKGRIAWDTLELRLFPVPRGVLRGLRIEIPDLVSGRVDEAEVHLRRWPLLAGRVEVRGVRVVRPLLRVRIPESSAANPRALTDPVAVYRQAVQPVLGAIRRFAPELTFSVEDAKLDLLAAGMPPLAPVTLTLHGRTDANGIEFDAAATGPLWKQVRVKARVEYADLKARVELDAFELKPQALLDRYLADMVVSIGLPTGNVHADARTDGSTALTAVVIADIPALTLTRGEARFELARLHAEASAAARGQDIDLALSTVRVGELVPLAKASLHLTGAQQARASVEIPALDLVRLRDLATTLAGDHELVRRYGSRIGGGQVTDLRVDAQAQTLAGLTDPAAFNASLKLERAAMLVPYLEQELADGSGQLAWNQGALSGRGLAGRFGQTRLTDGMVDYRSREGAASAAFGYDMDLAQALDLARRLRPQAQRAALDAVRAVTGRAQGRLAVALERGNWSADLTLARSDSVVRLRAVPWPASLRQGRVVVTPKRLTVSGAAGAVGTSTFSQVGVELATDGPLRLDAARGAATLALKELYPWLREQAATAASLRMITAVTGSVDLSVNRVAGRFDQLDALQYDATLRPRQVRVEAADLPAPVLLDGGTINVTPRVLRFDAVMSALLDARARVTGVVRDIRTKELQVDAALADGEVGPTFMAWAWPHSGAPARLQPKAPIHFAAQRVRWSSEAGWDLRAHAQIVAGPSLDADVAWKGDGLDLRTVRIKDRESDATLGLLMRGRLLDTRFSGVLTGRSLAGLLAHSAGEHPGRMQGDFRATIDRDLRGRTTTQGRLSGERIQLEWLLGLPLSLERIDLEADKLRLRVNQASVDYADQKATIRGEVRHGSAGPVIDAQIDSPGILVDALLLARGEPGHEAPTKKKVPEAFALWPLPVTGTLKLRAGFLEYGRYRAAPVAATLTLDLERVRMDVTKAALCGIAFPFTVELTPQGAVGSARVLAKGQQLDTTARCLTDQRVLLTGEFELRADLRTSGRRDDLVRNLEGPVELHARQGKVMKFALLGNILALKSISGLFARAGSRPDEAGFDYRQIDLRGQFGGGQFKVEEGAFDSAAMGLAATGWIGLEDRSSSLTVLVAPFSRVDRLVRRVPIVGYILGGALTSVPVGVSGDIRDPVVVPLGAKAVTSELMGIFERMLKLPRELLQPSRGAAAPAATGAPPAATAPVNAARAARQDRVEVVMDGDTSVVNVFRDQGIGGVAMKAPRSGWPPAVVVRLHGFPALERFTATAANATLGCESQRPQGRGPEQVCTLNGARIDTLRKVGAVYEVTLPNSMLTSATAAVEIRWADRWR